MSLMELAPSSLANIWSRALCGSQHDRDKLLLHYLPMVEQVAKSLRLPFHVELDDLTQHGALGLAEAIEGYDSTRGEFEPYAAYTIRWAIIRGLREEDWVTKYGRQAARKIERAEDELRARLGREATTDEVADELGFSLRKLHKHRTTAEATSAVSSYNVSSVSSGSWIDEMPLLDSAADSGLGVATIRASLVHALRQLDDLESTVLILLYAEGLKTREVGQLLGVVDSQVSKIKTRALAQVQRLLGEL